jgi:hypothetical protein
MKGSFKYQHDVRQLENGNLLVFDNRGVENLASPTNRYQPWG